MLTVIAFCAKDKAVAARLAHWIVELGGVQNHDCLLGVHIDTDSTGVIDVLATAFRRVAEFPIDDTETIYPYIANMMWKRCAQHVADMNESMPWLWLEPDAVPLKPEWLDQIEAEYQASRKPFLLDRVVTPTSVHHSGVGVYPARVRDYTMKLWNLSNVPWDVFFKDDFAPHTKITELIHDKFYQVPGDGNSGAPIFPDAASLAIIEPGAVLFHRNKDGSLIDRLKERSSRHEGVEQFTTRQETEDAVVVTHHNVFTAPVPPELVMPEIVVIEVNSTSDTIVTFSDGSSQNVPCSRVSVPDDTIGGETSRVVAPESAKTIADLLRKIDELEVRLSEKTLAPRKPKRSAAEQAKINERMAKARASRRQKLTGVA